jgi:hypothetical protein
MSKQYAASSKDLPRMGVLLTFWFSLLTAYCLLDLCGSKETAPPAVRARALFGDEQRINEIVEILVAIFFICLNIKCFRSQTLESLENRRKRKKSGDWNAMLLPLGPKSKKF